MAFSGSPQKFDLDAVRRETVPGRIVAHLRRDVPLGLLDVAVVLAAYLIPLVLRFEGSVPSEFWSSFWSFTPLLVVVHLAANLAFRLYGHMWRYASIEEARRVILASASAGVVVVILGELLGDDGRLLPLSVVVFGAFLALLGFGAIRFQSRLFAWRRRTDAPEPKRVLIVGAGDAGEMVIKDIVRNQALGLHPVGIVDDDPRKFGRTLHGVKVLGARRDIPDLVGARVSIRDVRDLRIDGFLGRRPVETDLEAVAGILRGRRVLITGAGGSIGAEITHQVAALEPAELLLLDHDETHLYDVSRTLRDGVEPDLLLADIRNR